MTVQSTDTLDLNLAYQVLIDGHWIDVEPGTYWSDALALDADTNPELLAEMTIRAGLAGWGRVHLVLSRIAAVRSYSSFSDIVWHWLDPYTSRDGVDETAEFRLLFRDGRVFELEDVWGTAGLSEYLDGLTIMGCRINHRASVLMLDVLTDAGEMRLEAVLERIPLNERQQLIEIERRNMTPYLLDTTTWNLGNGGQSSYPEGFLSRHNSDASARRLRAMDYPGLDADLEPARAHMKEQAQRWLEESRAIFASRYTEAGEPLDELEHSDL